MSAGIIRVMFESFICGAMPVGYCTLPCWTFNNGEVVNRAFDLDGRMFSNSIGSVLYDSADRIYSKVGCNNQRALHHILINKFSSQYLFHSIDKHFVCQILNAW